MTQVTDVKIDEPGRLDSSNFSTFSLFSFSFHPLSSFYPSPPSVSLSTNFLSFLLLLFTHLSLRPPFQPNFLIFLLLSLPLHLLHLRISHLLSSPPIIPSFLLLYFHLPLSRALKATKVMSLGNQNQLLLRRNLISILTDFDPFLKATVMLKKCMGQLIWKFFS